MAEPAFFQPWSTEEPPVPPSDPPAGPAGHESPGIQPGPSSDAPGPDQDLVAYLRHEGIRELERVGHRLERAGHRGQIQDLLALPTPALRLLIWLRPGLLEGSGRAGPATLELEAPRAPEARLRVRIWWPESRDAVTRVASLPDEVLTPEAVRRSILQGVGRVLEEM